MSSLALTAASLVVAFLAAFLDTTTLITSGIAAGSSKYANGTLVLVVSVVPVAQLVASLDLHQLEVISQLVQLLHQHLLPPTTQMRAVSGVDELVLRLSGSQVETKGGEGTIGKISCNNPHTAKKYRARGSNFKPIMCRLNLCSPAGCCHFQPSFLAFDTVPSARTVPHSSRVIVSGMSMLHACRHAYN